MKLKINIDGACRGNPGPGSSAAIIRDADGKLIKEVAKHLGTCTNNQAEFFALEMALSQALAMNADEADIFSDSQLLVNQYNGIYRVKNPALAEFMREIKIKASKFRRITLTHVPREQNGAADRRANLELDRAAKEQKEEAEKARKWLDNQPTLF